MIKNAFADLSLGYKDGIYYNELYSIGTDYCKIVGRINELKINIDKNSECLAKFDINLVFPDKVHYKKIYSHGVQNGDENRNCGTDAGIYKKIDGKIYNPKIGDYIIAKINLNNNYINQLYSTKGKNIEDLVIFTNSINIPYCIGNVIKEDRPNILVQDQGTNNIKQRNDSINNIYWAIIFFLIIIILILIFKIYKSKK